MKTIYFTVTGLFHLDSTEFIEQGMRVQLIKEPDNEYDHEAIMVKLPGIGKIGYVANSIKTVVGDEAYSAGRLYDKIGEEARGEVVYNLGNALQCRLLQEGVEPEHENETEQESELENEDGLTEEAVEAESDAGRLVEAFLGGIMNLGEVLVEDISRECGSIDELSERLDRYRRSVEEGLGLDLDKEVSEELWESDFRQH